MEEALLRLGVVMMAGRVQVRHRRMADGLDGVSLPEPRGEPLDPELLGGPRPCGPVGLEVRQVGQRCGGIEGRDPPERAQLLRLRLEAPGGEHRLQIRVRLEQRRGGLLADAARSRDLVGRVAAKRDEVAHLARLDAVALPHLRRPDPLQLADAAHGLQDRDVGGCELERVAVGGRDERRAAARPLGRDGRREEVVGLEARRACRRRFPSTRRAPAAARAARRSRGRTRARTGSVSSSSLR